MRIILLLNILFTTMLITAQTREAQVRFPLPGEVPRQIMLNNNYNPPLFYKPDNIPSVKNTLGYLDTTYRIRFTDLFSDVNDWDSAYFVSGYIRDSTHYYYDPDHLCLLGLMKIDYSGNVIWKRTDSVMRGDHFTALNTSIIKLEDGKFLQVGHVKNDYNNWKNYDWRAAVYTKFDTDGNTIWQKVYMDTAYLKSGDWPMSVIPENDGGFTVTALIPSDSKSLNQYDTTDTYLYTDTTYIGLIRYDSLGNEVFRQRHFIGGHPVIPSIGLLMKMPDKGYIVGGVNYFSGDLDNYYLLKTDSLFNFKWVKLISQTLTIYPLIDILPFDKEKYYFSLLRADTPIVYDAYGNKYYNGYHQTGVLDSAFNIIEDTMFVRKLALYFGGPSYYSSVGDVRGLDTSNTGEMVVCSYINDGGAYLMNMGSGTNFKWGNWIAQFPYFREEPYKMRRAHDGGYLIVGRSSRPCVGGWFVKTDTNGFALPNGADTLYHIGYKENNIVKKDLIIYPNPFLNTLTIELQQTIENGVAFLYDFTGKQLIQTPLTGTKTILNTTSLARGIYLLKVVSKESGVFCGKIVKQ